MDLSALGFPGALPDWIHGMTLKSRVCGSSKATDIPTTPISITPSRSRHPTFHMSIPLVPTGNSSKYLKSGMSIRSDCGLRELIARSMSGSTAKRLAIARGVVIRASSTSRTISLLVRRMILL
ncbi:hypothetical protein LB505_012852 [Fusarium chuoi]|nr:hypothetical protein LB505_012852 [Fusarium chuoi]